LNLFGFKVFQETYRLSPWSFSHRHGFHELVGVVYAAGLLVPSGSGLWCKKKAPFLGKAETTKKKIGTTKQFVWFLIQKIGFSVKCREEKEGGFLGPNVSLKSARFLKSGVFALQQAEVAV